MYSIKLEDYIYGVLSFDPYSMLRGVPHPSPCGQTTIIILICPFGFITFLQAGRFASHSLLSDWTGAFLPPPSNQRKGRGLRVRPHFPLHLGKCRSSSKIVYLALVKEASLAIDGRRGRGIGNGSTLM